MPKVYEKLPLPVLVALLVELVKEAVSNPTATSTRRVLDALDAYCIAADTFEIRVDVEKVRCVMRNAPSQIDKEFSLENHLYRIRSIRMHEKKEKYTPDQYSTIRALYLLSHIDLDNASDQELKEALKGAQVEVRKIFQTLTK